MQFAALMFLDFFPPWSNLTWPDATCLYSVATVLVPPLGGRYITWEQRSYLFVALDDERVLPCWRCTAISVGIMVVWMRLLQYCAAEKKIIARGGRSGDATRGWVVRKPERDRFFKVPEKIEKKNSKLHSSDDITLC